MADPATEAREEQGLHDLVTTFTRSLMQENTAVPMSVAAKLTQFISELYVLWRENKPVVAPPEVLREMFVDAVTRHEPEQPHNGNRNTPVVALVQPVVEPGPPPLTKRGKPRLSREEIAARRKAVWTPEKRAQHRRRTLERMAREQQQSRIPQSIPA